MLDPLRAGVPSVKPSMTPTAKPSADRLNLLASIESLVAARQGVAEIDADRPIGGRAASASVVEL